jgi:transposase
MTLRLRNLSEDERVEVQRMARSHTLRAGMVRRAQIIVHAMSGLKAEEIATRMDLCGNTVRHWLNRFNARGLKGSFGAGVGAIGKPAALALQLSLESH